MNPKGYLELLDKPSPFGKTGKASAGCVDEAFGLSDMAAIWQNEFGRKTRHSVTFSLIYRDEVVRMLKIKGDSCHDFRHIRTEAKRDANRRPMSGVAKVSPNIASWCGSTPPTESSTFDSSEPTECTTPLTRKQLKVRTMEIVPIKSERDCRRTLKEIEGLMTAKRNTPEGDRLDVLVTLVEAWEARNHALDLPDPINAIHYHMEQNGLAPKDLVAYIGSRNRVYEVLNRKRPLSHKMIWRLHTGLGIPAESLIKVVDEAAPLTDSTS